MLNSSCSIEEPLFVLITHWITSFFSIPIYGMAFLVFFLKCPKYFKEYRNYLFLHTISGLLLDFHIRSIWKLSIPFPWPSLCSTGFFAEYSVISFQLFIVFLIFTGITALFLFIYRMKAATIHVENAPLQSISIIFSHTFHVSSCILVAFTALIYPDLKRQKRYKLEMEKKFGTLPQYMWCDNCFFMQFDSWLFVIFYILSYCTLMFAFISGFLASLQTVMSLHEKNLRLSARTLAIQKNLIYSLMTAVIVHITMILTPLTFYFILNVGVIDIPFLAHFFIIILQDHGSVSTLTMIVTNKVLRKAIRSLLSIPERHSTGRVFRQKTSNAAVVG